MDTTGGAAEGGAAARPDFPALTAREMGGGADDFRRIRCPPHRLTPLRNTWENIVTPTVEHMKLQIRQGYARYLTTCRGASEGCAPVLWLLLLPLLLLMLLLLLMVLLLHLGADSTAADAVAATTVTTACSCS